MLTSNGYSISYEIMENRIIISLPPTWETITDTTELPQKRKLNITSAELVFLLAIVMKICEGDE